MTVRIRPDRRLIRAIHHSTRFVLVEVEAPAAPPRDERTPVNLAFVLDRSGSMAGQKIALAKRAIEEALARLQPEDRFSVVVYDDVVEVVVPSVTATVEARRTALERLAAIDARGSTNLAEGWLRGCEQVAGHLVERGIDRVLLLTDGLANVGMTDRDELAGHAAELRRRGVATSTFGIGGDFDEALLQAIADAGGGHFRYVASAATIPDHVTSEVGEALEVVAREVTVQVTAPEGITVESLSPYRVQAGGNRTVVALGDLVDRQTLQVVLRLTFPFGEPGRETGVIVGLADHDGVFARDGAAPAEPVRVVWTYADDRDNNDQPRDVEVDRAVARIFAARARQEAVAANRLGDFRRARQVLEGTAQRIRHYAGRDRELRRIVEELERELYAFTRPMAEDDRKSAFAGANYSARCRSVHGSSLKRG